MSIVPPLSRTCFLHPLPLLLRRMAWAYACGRELSCLIWSDIWSNERCQLLSTYVNLWCECIEGSKLHVWYSLINILGSSATQTEMNEVMERSWTLGPWPTIWDCSPLPLFLKLHGSNIGVRSGDTQTGWVNIWKSQNLPCKCRWIPWLVSCSSNKW